MARAQCRLCSNEAELRRSHIIPEFFRDDSGLLYPTGKKGQLQPFTQVIHTQPGKRFDRKQHGYWETRHGMVEHLLCGACESRLSALEDHAKRVFYGGSSPIRLHLPLVKDPLFRTDYKKMKLFQLSILWRAAEAKGEFFSAVQLSEVHRSRLREMLLSDNPGSEDEYPCAMTRLVVSPQVAELQRIHGISIETGYYAPVAHDHGSWQSYTFLMGGLCWCFCVGHTNIPDQIRNAYIKENGQFWLMPLNADGFLFEFSRKAVAAGNVTEADAIGSMAAKCGITADQFRELMEAPLSWEEVHASWNDAELQAQHDVTAAKRQYLATAQSCPACGKRPDELVWIFFRSADETWRMECGCAGWLLLCTICDRQVDFFIESVS